MEGLGIGRHDLWAAVDGLRERVEKALFDEGDSEAAGIAVGGLAVLEMLLRPWETDGPPAALHAPAPATLQVTTPLAAAVSGMAGATATAAEEVADGIAAATHAGTDGEPYRITAGKPEENNAALACATAPKPTVTVPATPKPGGDDAGPWVTEERRTLLQRLWGDPGESLRTITAAVNATPGRRVNNDTALYKMAEMAGLPRKRTDAGMTRGTANVADSKPPTPDEEDIREAKILIREGRHAHHIAEEFGWTVDQAAKAVAEVRAEQQAAESAAA
jgi:hypothetical protein